MTPRGLHRSLAAALLVFIALHLSNHVTGLWGQSAHGATQNALAKLYRQPLIESVLLALFAAQTVIGLRLALPRLRFLPKMPLWSRLHVSAGLYLAAFLIIHVSAVLIARASNTPTDLAFAATAFQAGGLWPWLFAPYYALAVTAIFLHLAAPLRRRAPALATATALSGTALGATLALMLMGTFSPISIPAAQIAAFPLMP